MPSLAYGKSAYRRQAGGFPELRLINMLVEAAPTSEGEIGLISRPGLELSYQVGAAPTRAMFYGDGVLGGGVFVLSGVVLFNDKMAVGSIVGNGPAGMAASATELVVTGGGQLYRTDGLTLSSAGFPDSAQVVAVAYLAGLFIGIRADTQRFYWSAVRDASSWDGLDYASAESSPDPLRDVVVVGDVLWLLGSESIEPWQVTGDAELPFSRVEGRDYQRGVIATGCACELDNTLFWIGDDGIVYRGAATPQRLSDHGIEEQIALSDYHAVFTLAFDGHKLFVVQLSNATYGYDVATGGWSQLRSFGADTWQVAASIERDGKTLVAGSTSSAIYRLSSDAPSDDGTRVERLFTAVAPVEDGGVTIDTLHLEADFGSTPLLLGQGSEPQIETRSSRDGGKTWNDWRASTLGRQGQYRARSTWRRFGTFDAPGAMFEFRTTDPVPLRISTVKVNEPQGGRSRG
jgi:hypothetical protein